MASESGFSNQKKLGIAQFKTIHNVGGDKFGQSVASKALYEKTAEDVITVTDVIGNSGQIEFLNVQFNSHSALVGDVLRINAGAYTNFEFDIISIVDTENFLILPLLSSIDISGELAIIMSWVTNKANADGSQIVTLAPVPIQFVKDNTIITVTEDTITATNNTVLPSALFIYKDGIQTPITKDTGTPSNNVGIPVEIVAASGTPINITAGDINVQLTDLGANFDAVRLGDGTGNYVGVNASNEAKVHDADALTKFTSIDGKLQSNGLIDAGNSSVTPLGIGEVFTGIAFDVTKYASINVCLISDVPSATDGVKLEVSTDGVNWDHNHKTTYSAATGAGYIFNAEFKFARVVYTNGAVAQSYFRLQTIFKSNYVASSLYTLDQTVTGAMFAQLNKSTIIGKTTGGGGGFVDVKVNPSGALTVEASVTGSVSVSNFPVTQPVSGSVSVSNFPATQAVTGTFWQTTQPVSGSVSVSNFPATQAVTGTFWQTTQPVSGSVSVSNLPATQNTLPQTDIGSITSTQKVVGLTAVRATVSGSTPSSVRKRLLIKPSKNNAGTIYLGSSSVTTSSGLEIIGPDRLEFLLDAADYFLISDTAGQVVEIIEVI